MFSSIFSYTSSLFQLDTKDNSVAHAYKDKLFFFHRKPVPAQTQSQQSQSVRKKQALPSAK